MGPVVEGTVVPNGARVPGTPYELDPIRAAFNIGTAIRWLDYNGAWCLTSRLVHLADPKSLPDCWLYAPSIQAYPLIS